MRLRSVGKSFEGEELEINSLAIHFEFESIRAENGKRPIGFRFSEYILNIFAQFKGHPVVACGEANTSESAEAKAFSELIERSSLILHGAETSNGWAAHPVQDTAKINAILELVERDAVLAQWYTSTPFLEITLDSLPKHIQSWSHGELSLSEFPILRVLLSTRGLGPSVTCLLVNSDGFGVSAHSCRQSLIASIDSAIAEACRAAHATLRRDHWKDSLKLKNRLPGFVDPGTHSVYYAYQESFPKWLFGKKLNWEQALDVWADQMQKLHSSTSEFEFTEVLSTPVYVGFAKHPMAFNLHWRTTSPEDVGASKSWARLNLKPETINIEPHIVS
jgi:hypothetical protein